MIYCFLTFLFWGIADLFYKIGNREDKKYNEIITGIIVGIVMGIHATIYLIINHLSVNVIEMIKYLPVSLCYIASMVIGYRGLRHMELSLVSPIENTSGAITSIFLIIFFKDKLPPLAYLAILLVFIGIIILSVIEKKEGRVVKLKRINFLIILFPIIYCLLDGMGTFLDAVYLDKLSLISEDSALLCYEYTFLIYAVIAFIYLKIKKQKVNLFKERDKTIAAILETAGQFFYVFAMSHNSTIGATIVGSYCLLSMILSHIFLKEKLSEQKYIGLIIAISGLVLLAVLDL